MALPGRETSSSRSRTTYSILRYLEAREEQINRTAALLADEMSRDTLKRLLAFRAVGPHHVNPPIEVNRTVAYYKRAKELMIAPSSNDLPPFEVEIFRVPFGSTTVDDTIRRFRPRLAISAYHSLDDLVELASKISEIERSYRLYLVHHSMHSEETVLYGYAE